MATSSRAGAAPSQLPTQQPHESNSPEDNRGEDGFIQQPVAQTTQKGPFLVGKSDIGTNRVVSRADFASVGIDQDTLDFSWTNGFKLPLAGINPEAVKFLTENEYGFSVSDE